MWNSLSFHQFAERKIKGETWNPDSVRDLDFNFSHKAWKIGSCVKPFVARVSEYSLERVMKERYSTTWFAKGESKALLYQREYFSTSRIRISKFWSGCFSRVASQVNRLSYCSFCNTTHDTHRERVLWLPYLELPSKAKSMRVQNLWCIGVSECKIIERSS